MYKTIVSRRTRQVFEALNGGDAGPLLNGLAKAPHHEMNGTHALGGSRETVPAIREWYERLLRLLPDLRFEVRSVRVAGPPWATTVTVEWADSAFEGRYENAGVNVIGLRWGSVHSIRIRCDSERLAALLHELAAQGVTEAAAEPVRDATGSTT